MKSLINKSQAQVQPQLVKPQQRINYQTLQPWLILLMHITILV